LAVCSYEPTTYLIPNLQVIDDLKTKKKCILFMLSCEKNVYKLKKNQAIMYFAVMEKDW